MLSGRSGRSGRIGAVNGRKGRCEVLSAKRERQCEREREAERDALWDKELYFHFPLFMVPMQICPIQ